MYFNLVFVYFLYLYDCDATPVNLHNSMMYLGKFGYLEKDEMKKENMNMTKYKNALMMFQMNYKLPMTGVMDKETVKMMSIPRCGNPDNIVNKPHRQKRYVIKCDQNYTFFKRKSNLTYYIKKFPKTPEKFEVRREIKRAFSLWSRHSNYTFKEVFTYDGDLELSFEKGTHDSSEYETDSFDGPGEVLGHAYSPDLGNEIHFDAEEDWTVDSSFGVDLLQVATHEIGHSLGLEHANTKDSVMYPMYLNYIPYFHLTFDDIEGIKNIDEGVPNDSTICFVVNGTMTHTKNFKTKEVMFFENILLV